VRAAFAAVLLAALLTGCGEEKIRGGGSTLPGPVPEGVTFVDADPSLPPAPEMSLRLLDGKPLTGSEMWEERPVVLFFFASWCTECARLQPGLVQLAERYRDRVLFVGVAGEDKEEALATYLDEHEVPYPVGIDQRLRVWRSYGVREPPHPVVVSRGGRVVKGWPGGISIETIAETLQGLIDS
jgi:thiol-disulfide isomerase/thioredoxin